MAKNGLLHTPPVHVVYRYQRLFEQIEECSDAARESSDRFKAAEEIMDILNEILSESKGIETSNSNITRSL